MSSSMSDEQMKAARASLKKLDVKRKALETEAAAIVDELMTPPADGGEPMGVDTPLTDSDGYPRADIDVFRARTLRHRLNEIRTDHKELMKQVEAGMAKCAAFSVSVEIFYSTTIGTWQHPWSCNTCLQCTSSLCVHFFLSIRLLYTLLIIHHILTDVFDICRNTTLLKTKRNAEGGRHPSRSQSLIPSLANGQLVTGMGRFPALIKAKTVRLIVLVDRMMFYPVLHHLSLRHRPPNHSFRLPWWTAWRPILQPRRLDCRRMI